MRTGDAMSTSDKTGQMMIQSMGLVVMLLTISGCVGQIGTTVRPAGYGGFSGSPVGQGSLLEDGGSLFAGDAAVLSDEAIAQILDHEYQAPALSRIALMPFGREVWSGWSEELSLATDQVKQDVTDKLIASPRVYDASFLPSILIPQKRSVPHLREAAARYQADLLLVYRSHCRSFEKYRFFGTSQSRAFCGVEAVVLDVRTGLVPYTSVASRSFDIKESEDDMNLQETTLKAQLSAVTHALSDISTGLAEFLDD